MAAAMHVPADWQWRWRWRQFLATALLCAMAVAMTMVLPRVEGAISSPSVTVTPQDAGATSVVDVAFTTGALVPVGGALVVVFSPSFYIPSCTKSNEVGFDASSPVAASANAYVVTITIAGAAVAAATSVSFTLQGVTNPGEGTTSVYTIRTLDVSGNIIESSSAVPGTVLAKTSFADAALSASTGNAGAPLQLTATFTTDVLLRTGSRVDLTLPVPSASQFITSGASVAALVGIHAASTVSLVPPSTLRLTVAGADIAPGSALSLTFGGLYNPAEQTIGTFTIRTRHSTNAVLQETTALTGATLTRTTLGSTASVLPASYLGGMVTAYDVRLPTAAYLPTGATISVTFPTQFSLTNAALGSVNNMPSTNAVLSTSSATTVVFTLGQGPVLPGADRGFTITGIVNPGSSCDEYIYEYCSPAWGDYMVVVADSAGNVFEQSSVVPGTPILKKLLTRARVRPLLKTPGVTTAVSVLLDTEAAIPLGGTIDVVFPSGYVVGAGAAASDHVGIPAASTSVTVTGQQLSLAIAGASVAPTTALGVTLSQLTTPPLEATGVYVLRTRDALGNIMEESDNIIGEGCHHLNACNGHGTCTLYTKVCICDPGWGAPSDVARYRSPDCTTRTCPSGYSWTSTPTDAVTSHDMLSECSSMGTCDRTTGQCVCFPGFSGNACQRMDCPLQCQGRGRCVSMKELASTSRGLPLSAPTTYDGGPGSSAWDADRIYGCVCDSAWAVGTGAGELQATEFFGGDCSKRHCPTGNDPETSADETDCEGKTAPGGFAVGLTGNLCLSECSNRGICDYSRGECSCFTGYIGFACQTTDALS